MTPIAAVSENIIDVAVLIGIAVFILILSRFNDKMTRNEGCNLYRALCNLYDIYYREIVT